MLRCVYPRFYSYRFVVSKRLYSDSPSPSPSSPVDYSFTSKRVIGDGRVFHFASVVVNKMGRGQSVLPVWNYACSLVKANPPTLAIAFLSRPTESALAAVSELALQFPLNPHDVASSCNHQDKNSISSERDEHLQSLRSHHCGFHKDVVSDAALPVDSFRTPHEVIFNISKDGIPLCENNETITRFSNGFTKLSAHNFTSNSNTAHHRSASNHGEPELAFVPPLIGCIVADQGRVALTTPIVKTNTDSVDDLLWLDTPNDEGSHGSALSGPSEVRGKKSNVKDKKFGPGNGANHCKICAHSGFLEADGNRFKAWKQETCYAEIGGHRMLQSDSSIDTEVLFSNKILDVNDWKNSKCGCSVGITRPKTSGTHGVLECQGQLLDVFLEKENTVADVKGIIAQQNFQSKKNIHESGISGKCKTKTISHILSEDNETKGDRYGYAEDEETYMLSLCVANMPGVIATGFHSKTVRLPWLPDLTNAVKMNHPHMVLLGAPGFDLLEFDQLAAQMFPNGSRAGASLIFIEEGKTKENRDSLDVKVFCGMKVSSTGAVGLSLSPTGDAGSIPVDAFAELVQMSLGMPHGSEVVCRSLFLPQRGKVEWLDSWQRAYKLNPDSVRDKIHSKLLERGVNLSEDHFIWRNAEEMKSLPVISVDNVLFPGFFIPLYIESPCDRLTVKQCMDQHKPFGVMSLCTNVILNAVDSEDLVGTTVNIKMNLFDKDCKSYIIAHGVRRFRIKNRRLDIQPGTFGQLTGQVEFFDDIWSEDDVEKQEVKELADRALTLCENLFPSATSILGSGKQLQDPMVASFAISHILPVTPEVKKRWLGMNNTRYRLQEQITFLNA
ncbi:hypothetical protein KP509_14G081300 [Ceratopteris richardii]|uniref:Lon N-terminal domain-containing protein n=1 Tax=Ceratopteris richardii TaxID=49495 RepID=A0A8T2TBN8_CERRI|nr:hypothetical protein KP509_14G081300 [Ceratopteris richardii]